MAGAGTCWRCAWSRWARSAREGPGARPLMAHGKRCAERQLVALLANGILAGDSLCPALNLAGRALMLVRGRIAVGAATV